MEEEMEEGRGEGTRRGVPTKENFMAFEQKEGVSVNMEVRRGYYWELPRRHKGLSVTLMVGT